MGTKDYINHLASTGKSCFTQNEAAKATGLTQVALRSSLRRLKKKGEIASPLEGFFIIIPPEYRSLGSLPPEQFIDDLMCYLKTPYYVGLLSAAQFYGAAHQKPQVFQVVVPRPRRSILVGRVRIVFITKSTDPLGEFRKFNTPRGFVNVATPEIIVMDLASFHHQTGGISEAFSVLSEISEYLKLEKFSEALQNLKKIPPLQRLGYFFDRLKLKDYAGRCFVELHKHPSIRRAMLDPQGNHEEGVLDEKWNLIVNINLEAENDT